MQQSQIKKGWTFPKILIAYIILVYKCTDILSKSQISPKKKDRFNEKGYSIFK